SRVVSIMTDRPELPRRAAQRLEPRATGLALFHVLHEPGLCRGILRLARQLVRQRLDVSLVSRLEEQRSGQRPETLRAAAGRIDHFDGELLERAGERVCRSR